MFTRVVELNCKPGKSRELSNAINEKIMPILQKQDGFMDEIVLVSSTEPDRVLALSFWKSRDDAERYQRQQYKSVVESLGHLIGTEPHVRTFEAHNSGGLKLIAGRAA